MRVSPGPLGGARPSEDSGVYGGQVRQGERTLQVRAKTQPRLQTTLAPSRGEPPPQFRTLKSWARQVRRGGDEAQRSRLQAGQAHLRGSRAGHRFPLLCVGAPPPYPPPVALPGSGDQGAVVAAAGPQVTEARHRERPDPPPARPPPRAAAFNGAGTRAAAGSRAAQRSGRAEPACRGPEPPTTGPPARAASSGGGCSRRRRRPAPA